MQCETNVTLVSETQVERAFVGFIRVVPGKVENSEKSVNLEIIVTDSRQ